MYAFAAGTQKMYDYLNDNPECMCAPIDYTNSIEKIASIDNFISINNAVDVDLYGQINAESAGTRHISGAGGQLDFVREHIFPAEEKALSAVLPHLHQRMGQCIRGSVRHWQKDPSLRIQEPMLIMWLLNMEKYA
mgnify:CR=1 FL=1